MKEKLNKLILFTGGRVGRGLRGLGPLVVLLATAWFALVAGRESQAVEVGEVVHLGSFGDGTGILTMEVRSAPLERIATQYTPDLNTPWVDATPPVTALDGSTPISVVLADLPEDGFFRVVVLPPRVTAALRDGQICVEVREDRVTPAEVLVALQVALGELPNLSLLYDPDDEETAPGGAPAALKVGSYCAENLDLLGAKLGWRVWGTTPKEDDEKLVAAYKPLNGDRGRPVNLPGDDGEGVIDDGWRGDGIDVFPARLPGDPPEPGTFDMKYVPDVPFEFREPKEETEDVVGPHVRLRLLYDGGAFSLEKVVQQDTGNGMLAVPFPIPSPGSFILVVRNPNGGIYHLYPFEDPRNVRAYDPPEGGSHGFQLAGDGSVRLTLPLLADNVDAGLKGILISLLKVSAPYTGRATLLTPEVVEENPNIFAEVQRFSGDEIARLLGDGNNNRGPRAASKAPTVTTLHRSGSNGSKFNVAIIGDGFRDTVADQNAFNTYVETTVMDTLQNRDIHPAVLNGMNVFRVNTFSVQSGITAVNSAGNVTNTVSTALEYRFSGDWNRCWMEPGPNSQALIDAALDNVCPQADFTVLVLNTPGFGGCAGGSRFTVTLGAGWNVVAHEFGHRPGTLGDEYTCTGSCGCYTGSEPGVPNLTRNTTRASLKWNTWVPSWRPLPTTASQIADTDQDVGLFPGATIGNGQWTSCIFRPSFRGRMNNNTPIHNPVGYTEVRQGFRAYQKADFRKNVVGDFDGDGRTDVVIQDDRQYALYLAGDRNVGANDPVSGSPPRGVTGVLTPTWYKTDFMYNDAGTAFWRGREADILLPGDFDGDGKDDLYVINHSTWSNPYVVFMKSRGDRFELTGGYTGDLPGWQRRAGDQFYVLDFNNDGRDDLVVYNGTNWNQPYLGMLRSTGNGFVMSRRYDKFLPGWEMGRHEKIHVGDFDGDGRDDLISFNRNSWSQVHLLVYRSTGNALALADRHYGTIPGIWQMRRKDDLHVLDFTGDGKSDVAIFNGLDWGPTYLAYLASDDGKLSGRRRYDNANSPLPGWQLQRRDRLYVSNTDGDADKDLVVYNKDNWNTQYLGILRSNNAATAGFNATGSWQDDWVNGWNLGSGDQFRVCEFRGSAGWDDLYVFNSGWFGMLRSNQNHFRLETIYRKWIYNHRFHSAGWW